MVRGGLGRVAALVFAGLASAPAGAQGRAPYEGPPIRYEVPTGNDPVARLQAALVAGEATLEWDAARGWVPSLLSALGVPPSSQGLVFSPNL